MPTQKFAQQAQPSIGELNGRWSALMKIVLIITPFFWSLFVTIDLPWRVWMTLKEINFETYCAVSQERLNHCETRLDGLQKQQNTTNQVIAALPPVEWRKRIEQLEAWDRANRADYARILIALEAIKAQLHLPPSSAVPKSPSSFAPSDRERRQATVNAFENGGPENADG